MNCTRNLFRPVNKHTKMKLKTYLSEAWMCSEFSYQLPMSVKIGHYVVLAKKNAPFPNFDFLAILPSNKSRSIVRTLKKSFFSVLWPPNLSH